MIEIIVLRLVHVLGAIFWVGSGLFTGLFLMPVLATTGPAASQVMAGLQQRRLFTVLPTAAVLTILSGLRLMWLSSGGFAAAYFGTPRGMAYATSGGTGIVAFVLALMVVRPAAVRAGALGAALAAGPDENTRSHILADLDRLRQRSTLGSRVVTWLLILSAAGMAVARYL